MKSCFEQLMLFHLCINNGKSKKMNATKEEDAKEAYSGPQKKNLRLVEISED